MYQFEQSLIQPHLLQKPLFIEYVMDHCSKWIQARMMNNQVEHKAWVQSKANIEIRDDCIWKDKNYDQDNQISIKLIGV